MAEDTSSSDITFVLLAIGILLVIAALTAVVVRLSYNPPPT